MNNKKFLALTIVSFVGTAMLVIDGFFSRIAFQQYRTEHVGEQLTDFAFWPLWLPLLLVQLVVVALGFRAGASTTQRNAIILLVFVFFVASLYSLIGHETLTREIASQHQSHELDTH